MLLVLACLLSFCFEDTLLRDLCNDCQQAFEKVCDETWLPHFVPAEPKTNNQHYTHYTDSFILIFLGDGCQAGSSATTGGGTC